MCKIDELKAMDDLVITAQVAGKYLKLDPNSLRLEARNYPERLGFPVIVTGKRVRIPRLAFIRFLEGGMTKETKEGED